MGRVRVIKEENFPFNEKKLNAAGRGVSVGSVRRPFVGTAEMRVAVVGNVALT